MRTTTKSFNRKATKLTMPDIDIDREDTSGWNSSSVDEVAGDSKGQKLSTETMPALEVIEGVPEEAWNTANNYDPDDWVWADNPNADGLIAPDQVETGECANTGEVVAEDVGGSPEDVPKNNEPVEVIQVAKADSELPAASCPDEPIQDVEEPDCMGIPLHQECYDVPDAQQVSEDSDSSTTLSSEEQVASEDSEEVVEAQVQPEILEPEVVATAIQVDIEHIPRPRRRNVHPEPVEQEVNELEDVEIVCILFRFFARLKQLWLEFLRPGLD